MASSGKQKKDSDSAGGAVDGLTPPSVNSANLHNAAFEPTIKQSNVGEKTIPAPPPTIPKHTQVRTLPDGAKSSPTVAGMHSQSDTIGDMPIQDLSEERLLKDAPRIEVAGQQYPSLNGIAMMSKLGQGGMGAVYYGIHPRLRSEVAVKVLPFQLAAQDPGAVQRFFREAQIAAKVRSPHLVNVMDVNEEAGLFFLVMEFVPGCSGGQFLKSVIQTGKAGLTEMDALDLSIAATIGLAAAHNAGIVHRDLKPENIMIPYKSRSQKTYDLQAAKLMDLGLARSEDSQQSLTGVQSAMGTPGYMAPEQALDAKTADKRSDVFGMGATLYALLAGRPPFRGDAVMKTLMATIHEPHEPLIKKRPDVSQVISDVLDKCLDKRQEQRYPDADALLKALRACRKMLVQGGAATAAGADDPDLSLAATAMASAAALGLPSGSGTGTRFSGTKMVATIQTGANQLPRSASKMPLIAGAAAVLVLGGAGIFFATRGGGKTNENSDNKGGVVNPDDPNTKKPRVDPAVVILTPEQVESKKRGFSKFMNYFKVEMQQPQQDVLALNDYLLDAQRNYDELKGNLPKEEAEKFGKEVGDARNTYEKTKKKSDFKLKIAEADNLFAKSEYEKAAKVAADAVGLAVSNEDKAAATARKNMASGRITFMAAMTDADRRPFEEAEAALKKLKEAEDAVQIAGVADADEKKKLAELKGKLAKRQEYQTLLRNSDAAAAKSDTKSAYDLASDAEKIFPERTEAKGKVVVLRTKLTESDAKAARQKAQEEYTAALIEAANLADNNQFDEALRNINIAINRSSGAQKTEAEGMRESFAKRQVAYEGDKKIQAIKKLVEEGTAALAKSENVNDAIAKLTAAKQIEGSAADQRVKDLDKLLASYESEREAAAKALQARDYDAVLLRADAALKIAPNSAEAKQFKQTANNRKAQSQAGAVYNKAVKDGDELATQGKFEDAIKAYGVDPTVIAKLEGTEPAILKAKIEAVQTKIRQRDEQARIEADRARIAKQKKTDFDGFVASARTAMTSKDWDKAVAEFTKADALFANDPAVKTGIEEAKNAKQRDIAYAQRIAEEKRKKKGFDDGMATAEQFAARNDYPSAFRALDEAGAFIDDPIIVKKRTEYAANQKKFEENRTLKAATDTLMGRVARRNVEDPVEYLDSTTRGINAAIDEARTLSKRYPNLPEIGQMATNLETLKTLADEVGKEVTARENELLKLLQGQGFTKSDFGAALPKYQSALGRLVGYVQQAQDGIAKQGLMSASQIVTNVSKTKDKSVAEYRQAFDDMKAAYDLAKKGQTSPKVVKPSTKSSAGEQDVDK